MTDPNATFFPAVTAEPIATVRGVGLDARSIEVARTRRPEPAAA